YQFDYIFDWTVLKYPQIKGRHISGNAGLNTVTGAEKHGRISGEHDSRALEAPPRRNLGTGGRYEQHTRNRTADDLPLSKDVQADPDKVRSSRNVSTSRYVGLSGTRPSSSGEATEGPSSRVVSIIGPRTSTAQRTPLGSENKSSGLGRATRAGREDPLRSFEFLQIRK
ncbi:hypothetical protein M8C21_029853, partial [Ambrosia artemisiifolia]